MRTETEMKSETEITDAQLAGLLLGVAALIGELRQKKLLDEVEIDGALERLAADIGGSKLAQAIPDDSLIAATLAPIEQLRRMNRLYDADKRTFEGWMDGSNG